MKAILEFLLPEERETYDIHAKASVIHAAMNDYASWLREICHHHNPDDYNAEDCRQKFYEIIRDRELTLL